MVVEVGVADGFSRVEREPAGEDAETVEQPALVRGQKVVAPGDRRPERPLPLGSVAAPAGQDGQRALEPGEQLVGWQEARPGRGQFDGQWEAVETAADLADGRLRFCGEGPLAEQLDGVGSRQGQDRVLALAVDPERSARRQQQPQVRTGRDEHGERPGRSRQQLLQVVEQQQHPLLIDVRGETVLGADRLGDGRFDEARLVDGGQRHPEHAAAEVVDALGRRLEGKPRLAGAACPGQRHDPGAVDQPGDLDQLRGPTDERAGLRRQVRGIERAQRRERLRTELVQPLGSAEVLEPMQPEVAPGVATQRLARRLGQDDLAAMGRRTDPGGTVDVDADVALASSPSASRYGCRCARGPGRRPARSPQPPPRRRPLDRRRRRRRRPGYRLRRRRDGRRSPATRAGARRGGRRSRRHAHGGGASNLRCR